MRQRRTIYYTGTVQGVGFRYTTLRIARQYDVTGFVKNLRDGRVELVAEGMPAELDGFLDAVQDAFGSMIHGVEASQSDAEGGFDGFRIGF